MPTYDHMFPHVSSGQNVQQRAKNMKPAEQTKDKGSRGIENRLKRTVVYYITASLYFIF